MGNSRRELINNCDMKRTWCLLLIPLRLNFFTYLILTSSTAEFENSVLILWESEPPRSFAFEASICTREVCVDFKNPVYYFYGDDSFTKGIVCSIFLIDFKQKGIRAHCKTAVRTFAQSNTDHIFLSKLNIKIT